MEVDADYVRRLFEFDAQTGNLIWKISTGRQSAGNVAGAKSHGYVCIRINGRRYFAHRLVWLHQYGRHPLNDIDHINGDRSDNRLQNLREVTRSENLWNMKVRPQSSTGLKGVTFDKARGNYKAHIRKNYKMYNLGRFESAEDAHRAYVAAAKRLFGEYARAS